MPRAFAHITYTPSVRAAQERYGSREANAGFDLDPNTRNSITERELDFIPNIDTFFMASVGENGWPYVQHRGGPKGFLKILGERTLGFADFAGNRQYISAGNISHDDRVVLILIDFASRRRLKVWGRARIVHESEDPELVARLEVATYRARIERAYVITIEALDFNCSQHITQRFTEEEFAGLGAPLAPPMRAARTATVSKPEPIGSGPLELVITGIRQLTPRVRAYELRRTDGADLPEIPAGAHLAVPVRAGNGVEQLRHYSIASDCSRRDFIEIAVLREEEGRGGSAAVHDTFSLGTVLRCGMPKNAFSLHRDMRPAVLIAGGIGITPIKSMAHALSASGRLFHLHYSAPTRADMAYRPDIEAAFTERASLYYSKEQPELRLQIEKILCSAPQDAVFYVCGPGRLIDAVRNTVQALGIDDERIRFECFVAPPISPDNKPIELVLKRSGQAMTVPANRTILDTVTAHGIDAPFDCRTGSCGRCATKVVDGIADHRDTVLTSTERERAGLMCICVSRAGTERLVLDL
ncbi:hypothetical protein GCM10027343_40740 [Noviherbaspirillum agri]